MVVNSDADITLFTRLLHMEIVDAFFNICAIACNKALLCQAPTISALLLGATLTKRRTSLMGGGTTPKGGDASPT